MGDTSANAGCLSIFYRNVRGSKLRKDGSGEVRTLEDIKVSSEGFLGRVNCIRTHIAMYFSCVS